MLPPEHFGAMQSRKWYKVRWLKSPSGLDIEGKIDLVPEEELEGIKNYAEILQEFNIAKCVAGIRLGYGKTSEDEIESWIKENTKK